MKKQNQTTFPTHHNNTNYNPNTNNNYRTQNEPVTTQPHYSNNNTTSNNNNQRQHHHHQQRNRCQIIPSEQFLPPAISPTQYQRQQPAENKFNYQQQQQNSFTAMCPATTTNYLPNQFNNFSQQHQQQYLNYQNQQQQPYQQHSLQQQQQHQNPNYVNFQRTNFAQQQQQSPSQLQRRQQLQLPLFNQNNANQQNHQRRQLFEQTQQQLQQNIQMSANSLAGSSTNNFNNPNNCLSVAATAAAGTQNCNNETEKFPMDANEIANFIANELFMQQVLSVDGIQSGVPTLTTSTLTPTTLKSIEDTFIEIITEPVSFQAGFIPPSLPSTSNNTASSIGGTFNGSVHDINEFNDTESDDSRISYSRQAYEDYALGGDTTENSSATTDSTSFQNGLNKSSLATSNSNSASANDFSAVLGAATGKKKHNVNTSSSATSGVTPPPTRRNQGGRRPAKASNLSPEEEEKRRIRRERNKLAAARCRKRRVDLTNDLLEEVAALEKKRDVLQKDIETLNTQKQELQYILEAHRPTCEKVRQDILTVSTYGGIIAPTKANHNNNDGGGNANIIGLDTTLASTGGRSSPIDLKPVILNDSLLCVPHIKDEPDDSLDHDGPSSPKRMLLSNNNPMIPPPLPKIGTLSPSLAAAASASLHTPIVTTAPVSFGSFGSSQNNAMVVNTLNALNKPLLNVAKQRPTTLPTMPRNSNLGLNVDGKPPTDINGVAIQTPSTGMFNFDSLMDGGTGLTPVSGPLVPTSTCSSQNKHPLELTTPTSEPSKLVSL